VITVTSRASVIAAFDRAAMEVADDRRVGVVECLDGSRNLR
jgi:hypothetical protein